MTKPSYLQANNPAHVNPSIRVNSSNWWVIEYPNNDRAILILRCPQHKQRLLAHCNVSSIDEITDIPLIYYYLAIKGLD